MSTDTAELDLGAVSTVRELHARFADAFGFPSYYGANWDAFWDCIRDPKQSRMPRKVVLTGWQTFAERFPRDAAILRAQIEDAKRELPNVRIVVA